MDDILSKFQGSGLDKTRLLLTYGKPLVSSFGGVLWSKDDDGDALYMLKSICATTGSICTFILNSDVYQTSLVWLYMDNCIHWVNKLQDYFVITNVTEDTFMSIINLLDDTL